MTPHVVLPPAGGPRPDAPVVVAYHLLDAPRTESAFAAAVPLTGLDAWKVYLGLPMSGSRLPGGDPAELHRLLMDDAVLNVHQHVVLGALAEFPAAIAEVKEKHGIADGVPFGVLGGSMGGAAAQLIAAEGGADIRAAVLVNPVVQFRATIDGVSAMHGASYPWTPPADAVAARLDFVARAGDLERVAIRYVTGADDWVDAIVRPVDRVVDELTRRGAVVDRHVVPEMAHPLAEEPGTEPAPPTPQAKVVDRLAVEWFRTHLPGA